MRLYEEVAEAAALSVAIDSVKVLTSGRGKQSKNVAVLQLVAALELERGSLLHIGGET